MLQPAAAASAEASPVKTKQDESMDKTQPSVKEGDEAKSPNPRKHAASPSHNPNDGGDVDTQIATAVAEAVEARSAIFEEKLKYWRGEVNQQMLDRFRELNVAVLRQL